MQAHERRHAGAQRLGDDLAAVVVQELVDHHAIVTGDRADLPGGRDEEGLERGGAPQPLDDRLHQGRRIGADRVGTGDRDELRHRDLSRGMYENVVEFAGDADGLAGEALGEARDHRRLEGVAQVVDNDRRQHRLHGAADHRLGRCCAEQRRGVERDVRDLPGRQAEGDQDAERLDRAGDVDRLLLAFALFDRPCRQRHAKIHSLASGRWCPPLGNQVLSSGRAACDIVRRSAAAAIPAAPRPR